MADAIRRRRLFEILVGEILVPAQRVRVRASRVELQRALEVPQRRLVFLLQAETVSEHAPRLRRQSIQRRRLLRQVRQPRLALQMPQHRRVHLHPLQPMRIHRARARERALRLAVLHHLGVRSAQHAQRVSRRELRPGKPRERVHRLSAPKRREVARRLRHRREERERRRRALREPTEPDVDARRGGIASRAREPGATGKPL